MIIRHKHIIAVIVLTAMLCGCGNHSGAKQTENTEEMESSAITFNADSAYAYIEKQCSFGPRVPNTDAHRKCGDWVAATLKRFGARVTEQCADLKAYDGTVLHARNIIGELNPETTNRVLLLAHWDSRPWADNDADPSKRRQPVMAANDGASGVGVLLEIARLVSLRSPSTGIDILLVDAEDWGDSTSNDESSWALGAQYWASNPHRSGYQRPQYGILLDMVGDKDATFSKEYFSVRFAPEIVEHVWAEAAKAGFAHYFVNSYGGAITDDHLAINSAGIPCIDIIDQRQETGFCPQWHTTDDTMQHISRNTLTAVGQTLVKVLF